MKRTHYDENAYENQTVTWDLLNGEAERVENRAWTWTDKTSDADEVKYQYSIRALNADGAEKEGRQWSWQMSSRSC